MDILNYPNNFFIFITFNNLKQLKNVIEKLTVFSETTNECKKLVPNKSNKTKTKNCNDDKGFLCF